jgi:hypothetical protein
MVVKATTPKPIVVTGSPQASSQSATPTLHPTSAAINTNVASPSGSLIQGWRTEATQSAAWRLDPLEVAKRQSLEYGFSVNDSFSLAQTPKEGSALVSARHNGTTYTITMRQFGADRTAVWAIAAIGASK